MTNLTFDHDLGGVLPTNTNGFVGSDSLLHGQINSPNGPHDEEYYISGRVTTFTVSVEDIPEGAPGAGDPSANIVPTRPVTLAVPEPSSWMFMTAGIGLIGASFRKKRAGPLSTSLRGMRFRV